MKEIVHKKDITLGHHDGEKQAVTPKVYLDGPVHSPQRLLMAFPPLGYEFSVSETPQERIFKAASTLKGERFLLHLLDNVLPIALAKCWLLKWQKPPQETMLTYAHNRLVFRPEPWVVEVEFAGALVGGLRHLKRFAGVAERLLASSYCRRIICVTEATRKGLVADLDSTGFQDKIEVVHFSARSRSFIKEESRNQRIKLLFTGDGASDGGSTFDVKGGRLVLETFSLLHQQYDNLELVLRASLPPDLKYKYSGMEGLRILDKYIPADQLEQEYLSADIMLLPSYCTPVHNILEAMSYELPVVTIDFFGNKEYVEDGKTGLVAPSPRNVPYYYPGTLQPGFASPQFAKAVTLNELETVSALVKVVSALVENPDQRKRMGKAARWEVEHGKFSLAKMREKLGRIFEEAIGGNS